MKNFLEFILLENIFENKEITPKEQDLKIKLCSQLESLLLDLQETEFVKKPQLTQK